MPNSNWTTVDIPCQKGKVVIVTGANGGLGYETALALAIAGASTVILTGRNETKGKEAVEKILLLAPNVIISFEKVDLGSLASVAEFCKRFHSQYNVLDVLINNAGVMAPPTRETTSDGFELQFGTNHLSHFALTAQLLPALRRSSHPRVVNVTSGAHRNGTVNFEDLQSENSYRLVGWEAYCQSKLCNILFTLELQRKSDEGGWGLMCTSAHPGISRTDLFSTGPGDSWLNKIFKYVGTPFFSQSAAAGALPILYAATEPEATPGGYYGPNGFYEFKGSPTSARTIDEAKDPEIAKKLWDVSVSLSQVMWP